MSKRGPKLKAEHKKIKRIQFYTEQWRINKLGEDVIRILCREYVEKLTGYDSDQIKNLS